MLGERAVATAAVERAFVGRRRVQHDRARRRLRQGRQAARHRARETAKWVVAAGVEYHEVEIALPLLERVHDVSEADRLVLDTLLVDDVCLGRDQVVFPADLDTMSRVVEDAGHAAPQADLEVMYVLHERPAVRHVVVAENLKFQALERVADVGRIVDGIRERIAFHVIRITDDQRHTAHFRWLRAAHMLARARLGGGVHDDGRRGCRQEDQRKRRKRKARTSALPAPSQQLPRHKINC